MTAMPPRPTESARWPGLLLAALLLGAGSIALLFPADVPWINDEPALLVLALRAKQHGELPTHGLTGSLGVAYGPAPLWFYMAAESLTHDLVAIVVLRVIVFMALTAVAIGWLARTCRRLDPLIGALAMLSPYLWFYSRLLWDNSFLIPLSALALAAYTSFSAERAAWKLWLTGLLAALMVQTHLMCAPLLAALVVHFAWRHRAWARSQPASLLPLAFFAACCVPYLSGALGSAGPRTNAGGAALANWLFPLRGGQFVSAFGLDYFFGERWQDAVAGVPPALLWGATLVSGLGIVGLWLGLLLAARWMRPQAGGAEASAEGPLATVCVLTLGFQVLLNGLTRTGGEPHYFNGTWCCAFALVWIAWSAVRHPLARRVLAGAHALALLVVVLALVANVHRTQGNTGIHFGPTLGTQLAVLDELARYQPQSEVVNETEHYANFPQAFLALQEFHRVQQDSHGPRARLHVRWAQPGTGAGRLAVEAEALPVK
jgi:hypothetical protein